MKKLIMLSMVLLAIGCGQKDPDTIGEWQGQGPDNTETFTVHGDSWFLEWEYEPNAAVEKLFGMQFFAAMTYRPGAANMNDTHAIVVPPGSPQAGRKRIQGSGAFYLGVIAGGKQSWTLTAKADHGSKN